MHTPMLSYVSRQDKTMQKAEERILSDRTSEDIGDPDRRLFCPSAFGISTLESTETLRAPPIWASNTLRPTPL
jgi:hypothetical protein